MFKMSVFLAGLRILRDAAFFFLNRAIGFGTFFVKRHCSIYIHVPYAFEIDTVLSAGKCADENGFKAIFVASKNNCEELETDGITKINRSNLTFRQIFGAAGHIFCDTESVNKDYALQLLAQNIFYIPYGVSVSAAEYSRRHYYGLLVHKLAKHIFVPSSIVQERFKKFSNFSPSKLVLASHPKADKIIEIAASKKNADREKIVILWNSHFNHGWGNFDLVVRQILEFVNTRSDVRFIFRAHPFFKLSEWSLTKADIENWESAVESNKIIVDNQTNYCEQLAMTDVLLTDGSSVMYDFFHTQRPIVYTVSKRNHNILAEEYKFLTDHHYICNLPGSLHGVLNSAIAASAQKQNKEELAVLQMAALGSFASVFTKRLPSNYV